MADLQTKGDSVDQATVVERALFVGRFCAALGQYSTYLPILLGPPSAWGSHKVRPEGSLGKWLQEFSGQLGEICLVLYVHYEALWECYIVSMICPPQRPGLLRNLLCSSQ